MTSDPSRDQPRIADQRSRLRAARRHIQTAERESAASSITTLFVDQVEARIPRDAPRRVAAYMPVDGEMSPLDLTDHLAGQGWSCWLPVVDGDGTMTFARWVRNQPLVTNRYGIDEPVPGSPTCGVDDLGLVLVPCVAVDRRGNRLGMGAGYYDRALAGMHPGARTAVISRSTSSHRQPLLVGLAFEVQIVDPIAADPWDVPMDVVLTDQRVLWTGRRE